MLGLCLLSPPSAHEGETWHRLCVWNSCMCRCRNSCRCGLLCAGAKKENRRITLPSRRPAKIIIDPQRPNYFWIITKLLLEQWKGAYKCGCRVMCLDKVLALKVLALKVPRHVWASACCRPLCSCGRDLCSGLWAWALCGTTRQGCLGAGCAWVRAFACCLLPCNRPYRLRGAKVSACKGLRVGRPGSHPHPVQQKPQPSRA